MRATESHRPHQPRPSETKNEGRLLSLNIITQDHLIGIPVIEKDSRDPQLLSNLSRLGPVRVDHHMQSYRLVSDVQQPLSVIFSYLLS